MIVFKILMVLVVTQYSLGASKVDELVETTSLESFVDREKKLFEKSRLEENCHDELRFKHFPKNCFQLLDSLLSEPASLNQWEESYGQVNSLCLAKASTLPSTQEINNVINQLSVAQSCKNALNLRQADLEYMSSQKNGPEIVINPGDEETQSKKRLL